MTADLVIGMGVIPSGGWDLLLILAFANYLGHVAIGHRLGRR